MTKVINIRHNPNWKQEGVIYIGRGSMFGNPYKIGEDGDRDEVIEKFNDLFYDEWIRDLDESVDAERILSLRNKILACYCRPKKGFQGKLLCHGQIIAAYLDGIEPEDIE